MKIHARTLTKQFEIIIIIKILKMLSRMNRNENNIMNEEEKNIMKCVYDTYNFFK